MKKPSPHVLPYPQIPPKENDLPVPKFVETEPPIVLIKGGPLINGGPFRLAVLLPSRGQIFSRAIESILREVSLVQEFFTEVAIFFAHGMRIPEAQQNVISRAMEWGADLTWLVEEDNYMPEGVLKALLAERYQNSIQPLVVSCDYFKHDGTDWTVPEWNYAVMKFHPFGCTLVDAEVWEKIGPPYCSLGKCLEFFDNNGDPCIPREHSQNTHAYGGQDVDFSFKLFQMKIPSWHLSRSEWRCGHLSIAAGVPKDNPLEVQII